MKENAIKKVFVAMSGGVDSSVAALLLKNQGYDVTGVFMRCYNIDGCAERDATDARLVAEKLGIPFYVWDFEEEYKKKVVNYMIEGYKQGITPNPDVECNREIKFGLFFKKAIAAGADLIATGHYVRSDGKNLFEAKDKNKDQSYFLWTLRPEQVERTIFPIGNYLKSEVRKMAKDADLPTANKKDSQGICFLGKFSVQDFLKSYLPVKRGLVFTSAGLKVGEHEGAHFYTIGQRHGLNLGTKNKELKIGGKVETKAHYVASKDIKNNTIVVAEGSEDEALYKREIYLEAVNFLNQEARIENKELGAHVFARVRYRQSLAKARIMDHESGVKLIFDNPVKFVAPGQSAVFYLPHRSNAKAGSEEKYELIGGGIIL